MEDDIKAVFGRVWPTHVASLTRYLISCRQVFGGDLDMFLVLAVIGERTFSGRPSDSGLDYEAFQAGRAAQNPDFEINLRSIAAYSGIPRETVRRKVAELEKRGWIARREDGGFAATRKAAADLEPLTEAGIQYIARMLELLDGALAARPSAERSD